MLQTFLKPSDKNNLNSFLSKPNNCLETRGTRLEAPNTLKTTEKNSFFCFCRQLLKRICIVPGTSSVNWRQMTSIGINWPFLDVNLCMTLPLLYLSNKENVDSSLFRDWRLRHRRCSSNIISCPLKSSGFETVRCWSTQSKTQIHFESSSKSKKTSSDFDLKLLIQSFNFKRNDSKS